MIDGDGREEEGRRIMDRTDQVNRFPMDLCFFGRETRGMTVYTGDFVKGLSHVPAFSGSGLGCSTFA